MGTLTACLLSALRRCPTWAKVYVVLHRIASTPLPHAGPSETGSPRSTNATFEIIDRGATARSLKGDRPNAWPKLRVQG